MKKIMFNDKYGLTAAVIELLKTNTRRLCKDKATKELILANNVHSWRYYPEENIVEFVMNDGSVKVAVPPYKVGEVVAVAQSYKDLGYTKEWVEQHISPNPNANWNDPFEKKYPGWSNKMFVPAELNKAHKIRITDFNVERLRDISDDDCLKEGVTFDSTYWIMGYKVKNLWNKYDRQNHFRSARNAFSALIDKVSGNGTWNNNPYVFAYTLKLVK